LERTLVITGRSAVHTDFTYAAADTVEEELVFEAEPELRLEPPQPAIAVTATRTIGRISRERM
jgi:hypothetical protein